MAPLSSEITSYPLLLLGLAAYLLPFGLLIFTLVWLTDFVRRRHPELRAILYARRKPIAIAALVVVFFLFDVPFLIGRHITGITGQNWTYWLSTAAGNWSPPDKKTAEGLGYWYPFSITVAILLNNTLYLVIITFVWRIGTKWRRAMNIAAALRLKNSFTRSALKRILEDAGASEKERNDILSQFDDAVEQGRKRLEGILPKIDKDEAPAILAALQLKKRSQKATPAQQSLSS